MAKKQSSKKPVKKTAKTPKVDAAVPATWAESKPRKERERDPRLPAAGTILKRTYKGAEVKVTVLEDGFRFEGDEYRSLSALAMKITGYAAINGVAWFGLTGQKAETPKPETPKEKPVAPAKTRAPNAKRVARGAKLAMATDAAPEETPAAAPAEASA